MIRQEHALIVPELQLVKVAELWRAQSRDGRDYLRARLGGLRLEGNLHSDRFRLHLEVVCTLFLDEAPDGPQFLSGPFGSAWLTVFRNAGKRYGGEGDYITYLSAKPPARARPRS